MRGKGWTLLWAVTLISLCCVSCASTQRRDIESDLITAMTEKCKSVEIKADSEAYVVDPTPKLSENGCPIALVRRWRDGCNIKVKEVEICACKNRQST